MSVRCFNNPIRPALATLAAVALTLAGSAAQASVVVSYTQVGNQVKGVLDGSFDTSFFGTGSLQNNIVSTTVMASTVRFGPSAADMINYTLPAVYAAYVSKFTIGTFDGGDPFVYYAESGTTTLRLSSGYLSGANLHSAGTWNGTFSSLGFNIGSYVMSLPGAQTLTVNVVDPNATTVPEPASAALVALALGGLGLSRRRAKDLAPVAA